ncbi:MAG: GAF domain-containing protein, partial [Acidimicrobiales bacterium]
MSTNVLEEIAGFARRLTGASRAAVVVLGADRRPLDVITSGAGSGPPGPDAVRLVVNSPGPARPGAGILGVRVVGPDEVCGALVVSRKKSGGEFTDADAEQLLALGDVAAAAIHQMRLLHEGQHQERALMALLEMGQELMPTPDATAGLRDIVRHALNLTEADLAIVAVPTDDDPETLVVLVAEGDLGRRIAGARFPVAGSLSGEVLRTEKRLVLSDVTEEPRAHQALVRQAGTGPAALVPLFENGVAFGTLCVARAKGSAPFEDFEFQLLDFFASHASLTLERARRHQDLERLAVLEDEERIARDLHDTVIQRLFATGMLLQGVQRHVQDPAV